MEDATADVAAAKGRHPAYQPHPECVIPGCGMPGQRTSGTLRICYRHGDEIADGWHARPTKPEWVYLGAQLKPTVGEMLAGKVKIGTTNNIERRMEELRLFCVAAVPGGRGVEAEIHRRLRRLGLQVPGTLEWFTDGRRAWDVLAEYASPNATTWCLDADEAALAHEETAEQWHAVRRAEDEERRRRALTSVAPSP